MKKIFLYLVVIGITSACNSPSSESGSPSSESGSSSNSEFETGFFLDSAVKGIKYNSPSYTGFTDNEGLFQFKNGETISFGVGGVNLGEATGKDIITPLELSGAEDVTDPTVLNMLIFLQSLDRDNNLGNGIEISDKTQGIAQSLSINMKQSDVNVSDILKNNFGLKDSEVVSSDQAIAHFKRTLQSDSVSKKYCEVSDKYGGGSIFTTHTNDCKQRKYREAYFDVLIPIFYQLGQISNSKILSEITVSKLKRDTVSSILKAKKLVKYVRLIKATGTSGASKEAINTLVGDTADEIGGAIAQSLGEKEDDVDSYGSIWYGVIKSYADAPAAILGDPGAIASLVENQVDSLWKIGSDTLAAWKLNNLTEQSNELILTQYTLEYYYSNYANLSNLMEALGLGGDFSWDSVVDKIASLRGYENGIFSEDYSTEKVVQQVIKYIKVIEKIVDADSYFEEIVGIGTTHYDGQSFEIVKANSFMSQQPNNEVQIFLRTSKENAHKKGGFQLTLKHTIYSNNESFKSALTSTGILYLSSNDFSEYGLQFMKEDDSPTGVDLSGSLKLIWLEKDQFSMQQNGAVLTVNGINFSFDKMTVNWTNEKETSNTSNFQATIQGNKKVFDVTSKEIVIHGNETSWVHIPVISGKSDNGEVLSFKYCATHGTISYTCKSSDWHLEYVDNNGAKHVGNAGFSTSDDVFNGKIKGSLNGSVGSGIAVIAAFEISNIPIKRQ